MDVRQTDERLKSYLNSRQPDRERMCVAILGVTPGYSRLEPRRPEGGPDGGRDIQCLKEGVECFVAVGFKNNATDAEKDRREMKTKFKSDLDTALESNSGLKAFVFFTNVDLTPANQEDLKKYARTKGIEQIEIYWRERIRVVLDSPEGYAIRQSFLDLALSDAEQKVFFERFGKDLQNVISGRLESVEQRIEEIAFQNWCRGKCRTIDVIVRLKNLYSYKGHDHEPFRFALRLHRVMQYGPGEMMFGCFSEIVQREKVAEYRIRQYNYLDTGMLSNEREKTTVFPAHQQTSGVGFSTVRFGLSLQRPPTEIVSEYGLAIEELKQYVVDFYCDSAWATRVDRVQVLYDHYLVRTFVNEVGKSRINEVKNIPYWPTDGAELMDRPVQCWQGSPFVLDHVCARKPVSFY